MGELGANYPRTFNLAPGHMLYIYVERIRIQAHECHVLGHDGRGESLHVRSFSVHHVVLSVSPGGTGDVYTTGSFMEHGESLHHGGLRAMGLYTSNLNHLSRLTRS